MLTYYHCRSKRNAGEEGAHYPYIKHPYQSYLRAFVFLSYMALHSNCVMELLLLSYPYFGIINILYQCYIPYFIELLLLSYHYYSGIISVSYMLHSILCLHVLMPLPPLSWYVLIQNHHYIIVKVLYPISISD